MPRPTRLAPLLIPTLLLAAPLPAWGQVVVVSGTLDEAVLDPGGTYAGTIRVRNAGAAPARARVYPADYRFSADGRSYFDPPGTHPRSSAPWLVLGAGTVALDPGEEGTIRFEVRLPPDSALRGTYWSVVMVETEPAAASARPGRGMGVTPVVRYAVQVATHVGREGEARLAFRSPRVEAPEGGASTLSVDIANAGERAERVELRLDLFDARGEPAFRGSVPRGLLYPGSSIRQRFDLGALGPGTYRALLVADTGGDEVVGAEYTIRL